MMKRFCLFAVCACLLADMSYAQRKVEVVETPQNSQAPTSEKVIKRKVAIGRFSNETQYAKGIFYDKENDPMGKQALDILSAKLAASGKFLLLERSDLSTLLEEAQKGENGLATIGADYMIIGSITEFGRKNTGKSGVFTTTKTQTVEAAVAIRLGGARSLVRIQSSRLVKMKELSGWLSSFLLSFTDGLLTLGLENKCYQT